MEKEMRFSKGFCDDLTSLMIECFQNNTDSLTLEFLIDGHMLDIDIKFKPHSKEI